MAKQVSYEESFLTTPSLFSSNESPLGAMVNHVFEANVVDNEKSISQMEQLEAGSTSHVNGGKITSAQGNKNKNATKGKKKRKKVNGNAGNVGVSREIRKIMLARAEQARRRKKANLYKDVRALLPNLPPKADQATVLEETIGVVMSLKETVANLENEKLKRLYNASNYATMASPLDVTSQTVAVINEPLAPMMILNNNSVPSSVSFKTLTESNVTISVCGIDANISICSLRNPNLLSTVCYILEKHNLEVVFAQVSSDHAKTMYMVHVRANVPPEFAEGFPYEEMYKKVIAQINVFAEF